VSEFRVLVTGTRRVTRAQAAYVHNVLDEIRRADMSLFGPRPMVVIQGECPYGGVDLAAKQWAEATGGARTEGHPAEWSRLGRSAGFVRNTAMVEAGADLCVAFPARGSRGTWDCLRKAVDAGIPSRLYPLE
jgi:hypothetical protein